ncbi:hypothetical protein HPB50_012362 [Hyalomma asiaticum]|uniref:Uncharacterized protein n=1 Tax=Hyalomma asiaticum TaxID=266040 RepID=A0ACB7S6N7_HYAAI|nr:hypothetical protein HPB50_012362 [Hyalomma asiaticum]
MHLAGAASTSTPFRQTTVYTPYQIRGFKTRSRQAGHSALVIKAPDLNERFLALRTRKDKDKQKAYSETEHSERLKTLLSDENLTQEEQQRLRVAFAEGYMACDPKARTSTKLRVFNIFRDLLGIILILAILFSFMGGPFRRVLIGTTNEVMPEDIDVTFDDVKGPVQTRRLRTPTLAFLVLRRRWALQGPPPRQKVEMDASPRQWRVGQGVMSIVRYTDHVRW